jgi:zinc protease
MAESPQIYLGSSIKKLANGISVIFVDTSVSDALLVMLCVSAGSADEVTKEGVANLLSKVFAKKLNENSVAMHCGAESNSYAGYDQSSYYFYGKLENLEKFLNNLGSVYSSFSFSKDDLETCRNSVEHSIINENQVDKSISYRESRKAMYWHSKYGASISGDIDGVKLITDDDLSQFKNKHYKNSRVAIIVAGNVDKNATIALVEKYFNKKDDGELKINRLQEPPHHGSTTKITKYSSQVSAPIVEMYWKIPNYRNDRNKALATEIFVNALKDPLRKILVDGQKIAASMSFAYSFWNYDYGDFCVTVTAANSDNVDELVTAISTEIKCLASDGLTDEQASVASKRLYNSSNLVGINTLNAVDHLSRRISSFCDFDFIEGYAGYVDKYDLNEVNKQAKEIFKNDPCVITVIMPEKRLGGAER